MNKASYIYLLPLLAILSLASCESITYDGEYSEDGYFQGQNSIYFEYTEAADTLQTYSFGADPIDTVSRVLNVPVMLAGRPLSRTQQYRVRIGSESTARKGVHYEEFDTLRVMPADSVRTQIPIKFLRDSLSAESDTVSLVLYLEPTSDLGTRITTAKKIEIQVTNVLNEPAVWQYYVYYFGAFERQKYLMMLAYYNSSETQLWNSVATDPNQLFLNFMKVYRALMADPNYQYKHLLPSNPYNPYQ